MVKFYWLTCSQLTERNDVMERRLAEAGVVAERFDGIHGATAGIAPTLYHFDSPGHFISPGKLAITLSKMLLWTQVLSRGDDPVLLLENDVTFAPDFHAEFRKSSEALPSDWQVVHVGHCCSEDKPTTRINERISEIRYPFCCHAVLWRKEALAVAVEALKRCSWGTNSDILLANVVYPKLRHYAFTPPLVFQEVSESEAVHGITTYKDIQGWFDFSRLYDDALRGVANGGPEETFVEVGAWLGKSAAYMAKEIKRTLKPVRFYAVDTWQGTPNEPAMAESLAANNGDVFPVFRKNMLRAGVSDFVAPIRKTSVEAANDFPDGSCRFVFIDADHSYEAVKADIQAWWPKVKPGGMFAGHDIAECGVRRAVEEEFPGRWRQWENCWIVD